MPTIESVSTHAHDDRIQLKMIARAYGFFYTIGTFGTYWVEQECGKSESKQKHSISITVQCASVGHIWNFGLNAIKEGD